MPNHDGCLVAHKCYSFDKDECQLWEPKDKKMERDCDPFGGIDVNAMFNEKSDNNGGSTDYYKLPPMTRDLQDLIEHRKMNFAEGNIFKAIYRDKGSRIYDMNKIIYFAQREINRLKKKVAGE